MRFKIFVCTTLAAIALTACAKKTDAEAAAAAAAAPAEAAAAEAVDTAAAAPVDSTASLPSTDGSADTGIPECDEYLAKVYACIADKMPIEQRDMMKKGIEQSQAAWAATTDKSTLAATCKQAMDQAKAGYAAMGCSF